jgi:hypothetical protein
VCTRWSSGRAQHPAFERLQALAYELDQAAGGIETACKSAYEGAPVDNVNTVARETLTRIQQTTLPSMQGLYTNLGCSAQRTGD